MIVRWWHSGWSIFSLQTPPLTAAPNSCTDKTHNALKENLKVDTYRLWTLGGHGRVKEEERLREWRARPRCHCARISAGLPDTQERGRATRLVNLKSADGGRRARWSVSRGSCRQPVAQDAERQTKAEGEFKDASSFFFLFPPPRFLWCNLTPRGAPASRHTHTHTDTQRTSSRPVLHQRLPLPLLSPFSLLSCFLVSFNSWFRGPAMSSPQAQVSAPLLECEGSRAERQRCRGGQRLPGLVCGGTGEESGVRHLGEFQ